jgi:hypothetical protein
MKMLITALVLATVVGTTAFIKPATARNTAPATNQSGQNNNVIIGDTPWRIGTGPTAGESLCERSRNKHCFLRSSLCCRFNRRRRSIDRSQP